MKKPLSPDEALNKAAAYCTLCERCTSEVRAKLDAWGMTDAQQENIIARLKSEKFIDEARYCRAFVNDKLKFNHWGRIKISAALREKQLPRELAAEAMENIDDELYTEILTATIAAKRKELKGVNDYTTKQKIMRFAASRGFEPAMIMRVIDIECDEMDI